jgi:hypothetical protein
VQITESSNNHPNSQPLWILRAGVQILDDVMRSHGFSFTLKSANIGSGGAFAYGEYRRRRFRVLPVDRSLELHVRHSLGLVTYHVGKSSLVHEDYMWAAVGRRSATHYPGFSTDPLDGFRHLRADLLEHCSSFLPGPAAEFQELHSKALVLKKTARLP